MLRSFRLVIHATGCIFLTAPMQIRFAHTDVKNFPDFTNYRLEMTKDPHSKTSDTDVQRKVFMYTMMFAGGVLVTTSAKFAVRTFIKPLGPSARTMVGASTEVNLAAIPEGKNITRAVPLTPLRHPQRDEDRVKEDKWLICLGVCTHLGCIPIAHAGDFPGGYYCPCHSSHYDASGRIRKGPALLNLEVPEYKFLDENTVIVCWLTFP
ncbi:unnamed protein product [Trichobilharzia regenti]|nr:unnamed protein product [Trichobilharzia regenti]